MAAEAIPAARHFLTNRMAEYFLIVTTAVVAGLLVLVLWNLSVFRGCSAAPHADRSAPMISVLVPARDEERSIERCVESLLRQDYPNFEVIVLDDHSTDGTSRILSRMQKTYPSLRVIRGAPLPDGWVGKCFACHQLSSAARGAWLLFTDADTEHEPSCLRTAIGCAAARGADLLTVIPLQTMGTFGEKLVLPLLHCTTFSFFPLWTVDHLRSRIFSVGIGQFMFFNTPAYRTFGGHEAVKDNIVEDIALARKIKECGLQLSIADGQGMVSCRMYRSFKEVWRGFSKNIFAGFNYSPVPMLAVMCLLIGVFVLPYVLLSHELLNGMTDRFACALLVTQVCINYVIRALLASRFRLGVISTVLHPLGVLCVVAIALNSWRWIAFGRGAAWKGRTYRPPGGIE